MPATELGQPSQSSQQTQPGQRAQPGQQAQPGLLSAVYLFNGDDGLKRETLLRRLRERVAEHSDLTMNLEVLRPEAIASPDQLLDALNTLPFGSGQRLIVVTDAERLPKELSEALVGYLAAPNDSTVLALLSNKLASNTRLFKAIQAYDKKSVIDVSSVKRSELPGQLVRLASDYGIRLDYQAALSLIDRVGSSMPALNNELKRLAAWALAEGKSELTAGDIVELVPTLVEPKPWELADALCQRDIGLTLRILGQMRSTQPTAAFTFCIARLREVLAIATLRQRGIQAPSQVAGYLGKPEWQLRSSIAAASRFSQEKLVEIVKDAHLTEVACKSGADAEQALVLWLVDVCQ